jgi:hypothetical protein
LGLKIDAASPPGDAAGVDGAWSEGSVGSMGDWLLVGVCGAPDSIIVVMGYQDKWWKLGRENNRE